MRDTRSRLQLKLDAAGRLFMWNWMSNRIPHYLVSEYPNSGGSWVSQMLADYLRIPFPRNVSVWPLAKKSYLLHGHHPYSPRLKNAVYVMRDGRDVMTSWYFHCLFENERTHPGFVDRHRQTLALADPSDVYGNMPKFIEYTFASDSRRRFHFTWAEFVGGIDHDRALVVRYEDLLTDAEAEMRRVIECLVQESPDDQRLHETVERFSFKNLASRAPGAENRGSFLRKGVAGDWRDKFSPEARRVFHQLAGTELIAAGYEASDRWLHEDPEPHNAIV